MPHEDRRLIFDYSETYKAIYALCVQRELKKPAPGTIVKVEPEKDEPTKLRIHIENTHENQKSTVLYSKDFLAAAMMLYCRSLGIPLPRRAEKSVFLKDDTVILRILM